jgi:hypothetical protein
MFGGVFTKQGIQLDPLKDSLDTMIELVKPAG